MLPNVLPNSASDHTPVLADEVRRLLAVQPGETVVDATFGAGGHARLLAQDLAGSGKLVAIDRDPSVKPLFDRFKASAGVDVRFLRGDFAIVLSQLAANDIKADAILLDIGVSSMQIDRPERDEDDARQRLKGATDAGAFEQLARPGDGDAVQGEPEERERAEEKAEAEQYDKRAAARGRELG